MSRLPQRSATAWASFWIFSASLRSIGAIVAVPPAAWIRSSTCSSAWARARGEDDMRAGRGQRFGGGGADAAAGAGDERELAVERLRRFGHAAPLAACDETKGLGFPSLSQSVSVVG